MKLLIALSLTTIALPTAAQAMLEHDVPVRRINAQIENRAQNAVANGASPARVRHAVKAYKQKLRRRYNAGH